MDTTEIIQAIDDEITRLEQVRALLSGHTAKSKPGLRLTSEPPATANPQRRKMSAEGRARIAAAQRARWAKTKRLIA